MVFLVLINKGAFMPFFILQTYLFYFFVLQFVLFYITICVLPCKARKFYLTLHPENACRIKIRRLLRLAIMIQGKKIVQPPFLKKGDKVAFLSPSYWLAEEATQQASEIVKSWGLQPVIGTHTKCVEAGAYAGTADERAADLRWALEQDDIRAIICNRGGYGSIHLLDRIPLSLYAEHPKWLVGYGDITVLLCASVAAGVMGIHGPMAMQLAAGHVSDYCHLRDVLYGIMPQYELPVHPNNIHGHAEGILIGGNLSSYSPLAGTKYNLAPGHDIILFIEELEESLHAIDRLFYMLRLQGVLSRVKGVILGEFEGVNFDLQYDSVEQMLSKHLKPFNIPVCCGFPAGCNDSLPLIEGAPASLDVTPEGAVLSFHLEGAQQKRSVLSHEEHLLRQFQ